METPIFSPLELLKQDMLDNPDKYIPEPPDPGFEILYEGKVLGGEAESNNQQTS